ncbi:hypothetical protein C8J56DRAFT_940760 [Mycena floridula]|nr:hypothetical protein C8J56DRAFT_940760 [Mycena floridula]
MVFALMSRVYKAFVSPPIAVKDPKPLKFGILGAAAIAPPALILPARSHPEVLVYAVAARDKARATAFAKKHGIPKVHNDYQELLNDPDIDVIYNPLPNGLHFEWTMKALLAGKHVLLEKPAANTAEETEQMYELAASKGLVLLEAFHYRFHPAIQRVKAIITSGELGAVKHISTALSLPRGFIGTQDIRFDYSLGGGAMMDMGCYTMSCLRYLASSNPTSVISASAEVSIPTGSPKDFKANIDRRTIATLEFPNNITGDLTCDLAMPLRFGIIPQFPQISAKIELEGGTILVYNFVMPVLYHYISIVNKGDKKKSRVEKVFTFADAKVEGKGESWWLTYRYQLEALVDRIKDRTPQTWVEKEDSIANMEWIEKVYEKTGLGSRPKSNYAPPQ